MFSNNIKNISKTIASEIYFNIFGGKGRFSDLKKTTYAIGDNNLSHSDCIEIKNAINHEILTGKNIWSDGQESDFRIWEFENVMPSIAQTLKVAELNKDFEKYLGQQIKDWMLMANKIIYKPGNLGSGGGIHRDSPFSHQIKSIWYLCDVDDDNGPFSCLVGSNRPTISQIFFSDTSQMRFTESPKPLKRIKGKEGTQIICDTKSLHAGEPIKKGTRFAITLYTFTSKKAKNEFLQRL